MRNKLLLIGFIACLISCIYAQEDGWEPIIQNGFGIQAQKTIPELEVYNDMIYVATAPLGPPATAMLWRSSNGIDSWEDVTPPLDADVSIHSFGKTTLGGGYFWLGTGNSTKGAQIFRTQNGKDWIPISKRGFGKSGLIGAAPNMVVFKGSGDATSYLYAAAGSHGSGIPAELWRLPYDSKDSSDWIKLIDFDTVATGMLNKVDLISYFEVWNDKIYFSTNATGQLWESTDGINFTQNMNVGYGFGQAESNVVISALEIFKDTMYITTTNFNGGQLWRTGDGVTFTNITKDAFGEGAAVNELRKPIVSQDKLWITGYTETTLSSGTPIWRSDDGINWVKSNVNGFGDTLNNGQNASLVGFREFVYFGGPNYTAGAQLWRTPATLGINDVPYKTCRTKLVPNPFSTKAAFDFESECSSIAKIDIFNLTGQHVKAIVPEHGSEAIVERGNLNEGIYFYKIRSQNGTISNGNFVIE